ncbi:Protein of unknown function [Gillisia sp. Hel1_33_143]|nr:Protein of unknown function [Gillisia sp. Hel1_33_143]
MFERTMEDYFLPCLNKQIFGMECYGCGGQRAAMLLLHGHFKEAFFMFPAIYSLLMLLFFLVLNLFIRIKNEFKIKMLLIYINVAVIFINYSIKLYHLYQI